jgi:hypothetical protein
LNPYEHCCSLAPQTSASANSATSATERYYRRLEGRLSNRVSNWWIDAVEWLGTHTLRLPNAYALHLPKPTVRAAVLQTKEKSPRTSGRICVAGVQGFEPQLSDSESDVLPLYDTPTSQVVPMKRFELLRGHPHYALNVARLPVPPHRRSHLLPPLLYTKRARFVKSNRSLWGNHIHRVRCSAQGHHRKRFGNV